MALFSLRPRRGVPDPPAPDEESVVVPEVVAAVDDLPPSRMRGTESLYGYVVGLELLFVAILNLVVDSGKGAPPHPQTGLQVAGLAASVAFMGLVRVRNRTVVGLGAIIAAFFVTLPKEPNSLSIAHIFALAVPLAYGLVITQRQRRALSGSLKARRSAGARRPAGGTRPAPAGSRGGRRAVKEAPVASGPPRSARYTPPKAKRAKGRPAGRSR